MVRLMTGAALRRLCASLVVLVVAGAACPTASLAQTCGTDYTVAEGDTLAQIAARTYGNPAQWTLIFYANQDRLSGNVSLLVPGLALRLPCIGKAASPAPPPAASAPAQAPAPRRTPKFIISSLVRRIEFLTADGLPPYTGRGLEGGGMMTHLINAAMGLIEEQAKDRFEYNISWVNDWSAHLRPLLLTRTFDVGFPWARPNCDSPDLDEAARFRCRRFFFSEPLYEEITKLFVRTGSRIKELTTEDVAGATLCRAAGQPVHELDEQGRNWVKSGKVVLMRPPTVDECFRLLESGTVHGVVEGELVGRASVASLGLGEKVRMIEQPVALTTYHALVSKAHPNARIIMYYVNGALERLRDSGEYDRIVEKHLSRFWEAQGTSSSARSTPPAAVSPVRKNDATPAPAPDPGGKTDVTRKY